MRDFAQVRHDGRDHDADRRARRSTLLEVDERGWTRSTASSSARSWSASAAGRSASRRWRVALGEETDTIEDVYEPYLLQLGFIQRTPRGRIVTKLGRAHIGAPAPAGDKLF